MIGLISSILFYELRVYNKLKSEERGLYRVDSYNFYKNDVFIDIIMVSTLISLFFIVLRECTKKAWVNRYDKVKENMGNNF
jgi:hypothetical protein